MGDEVRCGAVQEEVSFAPRSRSVPPISGGILALTYPAVLIIVALSVGFRRGGDMTEFAATLAATVLFLIAAPTSWVLSFSFIEVTRFTVIVFGIVTSAPLWYVLGVGVARRSPDWMTWIRRYAVVCVVWTALNLVVFGIIAAAAG
ncbi:MAG: hypothetical protein ACR2NG_06465 [Acidimicrobiia bacterium]